MHPVDLRTRAAGIRCQMCTAPRRARRRAIANPQALSLVNSRTATLHGCAKLRPKRPFLLDRARPVFFSARPKRKWGAHCPAINIAAIRQPNGWHSAGRRGHRPIPPAADTSAHPSPPPGGPPLSPSGRENFLNSQILHRYPLYKWNTLRYDSSVSTRRI